MPRTPPVSRHVSIPQVQHSELRYGQASPRGSASPAFALISGVFLFALASCSNGSSGDDAPGGSGGPANAAGAAMGGSATGGASGGTSASGSPSAGGNALGGGGSNAGGAAQAGSGAGTAGSPASAGTTSAGGSAGASQGGQSAGGTSTQAGQGGGGAGHAGAGGSAGGGSMQSCTAMVDAATAFLAQLGASGALRDRAQMDFAQRTHFKFTPGDRPGVALRDLSETQRRLALALVATGLSEEGFTKAEITRQNELVLRAQENSDSRDPLGYFVAIYGEPAREGSWAWHWEGHHLSLHFTLADCTRVATAPTFIGANPARIATSVSGAPPMGTRNLGQEEDLARQLAGTLNMDATKRAAAIVANQIRDTPETTSVSPLMPRGILATQLSAAERDMLRTLIAEYANNLAPELAAERLARIEDAGIDGVSFLWSGSLTAGQAHYYRVQGPSFLIEYANEQNNANHVHTAWRDFNGDFGRDLIAEHRLAHPH